MRILVTGATGGLGQNVCRILRAHGHVVRATGRNAHVAAHLKEEGFDFMTGDLTLPVDRTLMKGCEAVVHCAALSSAWGGPEDFEKANVNATRHLLEACRAEGIRRFIYISSPSVYFNFTDRLGVKESDAVAAPMSSAYAATKYKAEQLVLATAQQGMEVIILRPRGIFGPHDQTLFPRILAAARRGILPLPDGGTAVIDITYADNVAEAIKLALEAKKEAIGQVYNITNGEPWRVRVIMENLFRLTNRKIILLPVPYKVLACIATGLEFTSRMNGGREPPLTRYTVSLLAKSQTLDINAARKNLGYHPLINIQTGMERFATWWQKEGRA